MIRRLVVLVVSAILAGMMSTSFAPSATAMGGDQTNPQLVTLTKIKKGTNARCPKVRPDKMFRVNLRVQKGERIKTWGEFSLRVDGRDRYGSGSRVNKRFVEFYFEVKRDAKVGRNLVNSFVYAEFSPGSNPRAVVERLCNSPVP